MAVTLERVGRILHLLVEYSYTSVEKGTFSRMRWRIEAINFLSVAEVNIFD
jgi:hypothetical protein